MTKDTKTALLDVAEHAARSRGIDGFSYADLAEAVGIRKASIHYHFPAKADLSLALMERYTERFRKLLGKIDNEHDLASDRIKQLIRAYRLALNEGEILCLCVAFTISQESLSDDVLEKVSAFRKMMTDWLKSTYDDGQRNGSISNASDTLKEATATLALLEGAHLSARSARDPGLFDRATELLRDRLTNG